MASSTSRDREVREEARSTAPQYVLSISCGGVSNVRSYSQLLIMSFGNETSDSKYLDIGQPGAGCSNTPLTETDQPLSGVSSQNDAFVDDLSGFVSTSKTAAGAASLEDAPHMYIYRLRAKGIDVAADSPFPWEQEIAVPRSMPGCDVIGCTAPNGEWIRNG